MQIKVEDPPKIVLKGTPREIGLEHGRQLRQHIHRQLDVYEEMFQYTANMSWDAVRGLAEEFRVASEQNTPDIYAEMQGIAEATGRDILDIVALNCRSEISMGSFSDGCTSLSWKKDDARVLAQNWDWTGMVKENIALMSIEQVGKPKIYMVTEAGIVGKIGFNSSGVGVCLNAIKAHPCISSKVPIHMALRLCLESTSVENAVQAIASLGGIATSAHILVADSTTSLGLELSPLGDVHLRENESGIITHANYFLKNRHVVEPNWAPSSPIRQDRIDQLTSEMVREGIQGDSLTPSLLRETIFSDTSNAPNSICACYEDLNKHRTIRSITLFNIVMILQAYSPEAEVVIGQPGTTEAHSVIKMPWN
ncbi:hypothetical protein EYZ11_008667 [Aspergillus tanneri]|uniref:Peptidase C45 hydrolase domain-containing protein n=1 Tax=Aspergillus tanneri TaxID=1220188 RepID=A0A4S3JC18_9EURO|nr:uncharacterized protein ATNIH1004_007810 [Aspergillus tanneri]KAA8646380.1 hypothetical protein ATNIH1004_007810 [Aspergillus tanneri]THC91867.1 hypothetical protein EYZ11_008667 [Aspergillus tanneri]